MTIAVILVALLLAVVAIQGYFYISHRSAGKPKEDHQKTIDDVFPTAWARMNTSRGQILFELYGNETPITTGNFINVSACGYYNGTVFHRVLRNFVVQGGGYCQTMEPKAAPFPAIKLETSPLLNNSRGTVSMVRIADPDSATTQFFINLADNSKNLGPGGTSVDGYAVFGRVVQGMDVVDAIANTSVQDNGFGERSMPLDPPEILSVTILAALPE
jgi:peptidyl-prolyl cis-trans isomerase A (cyclophilin A)